MTTATVRSSCLLMKHMKGHLLYIEDWDADYYTETILGVYLDENKAKRVARRLEALRIAEYAKSPSKDRVTLRWSRYHHAKGNEHRLSVYVREIKVK